MYKMQMRKLLLTFPLLVLAAGIQIACDDDPVSSYEPNVVNQQDNFHLVVPEADGVDTVVYYFWSMQGTSANIDQSADLQGGSVSITVDDNDRHQVYSTDLRQIGSFVTQPGTPGSWRIRVGLSDFSGRIDFRLQRR